MPPAKAGRSAEEEAHVNRRCVEAQKLRHGGQTDEQCTVAWTVATIAKSHVWEGPAYWQWGAEVARWGWGTSLGGVWALEIWLRWGKFFKERVNWGKILEKAWSKATKSLGWRLSRSVEISEKVLRWGETGNFPREKDKMWWRKSPKDHVQRWCARTGCGSTKMGNKSSHMIMQNCQPFTWQIITTASFIM